MAKDNLKRRFIHQEKTNTMESKNHEKTTIMVWSPRTTTRQLPSETSTEKVMEHAKWPVGRPKTTWLDTIFTIIKSNSNIFLTNDKNGNLEILKIICNNRQEWGSVINSIILTKSMEMQWWWYGPCCIFRLIHLVNVIMVLFYLSTSAEKVMMCGRNVNI